MTPASALLAGAATSFDVGATSFGRVRSRLDDYNAISAALSFATGETTALLAAGIAEQTFRVIAADEFARLVDATDDVRDRFGYVLYERTDLGPASLIAIPAWVLRAIRQELWDYGFPSEATYLKLLTEHVARYLKGNAHRLPGDEIAYLLRIITFSRAIRGRGSVVASVERRLRSSSRADYLA